MVQQTTIESNRLFVSEWKNGSTEHWNDFHWSTPTPNQVLLDLKKLFFDRDWSNLSSFYFHSLSRRSGGQPRISPISSSVQSHTDWFLLFIARRLRNISTYLFSLLLQTRPWLTLPTRHRKLSISYARPKTRWQRCYGVLAKSCKKSVPSKPLETTSNASFVASPTMPNRFSNYFIRVSPI